MKIKKQIIGILLCVCTVFLAGCSHFVGNSVEIPEGGQEKIKIVTTAFPPYDFARELAGGEAQIQMLLKPGSEAHNYEPTPQDMIAIEGCDVFIYIGGEAEDWVEQVLEGVDNSNMKVLALMDCVEGLEEVIVEGMYVRQGTEHDHSHEENEGTAHIHDESCEGEEDHVHGHEEEHAHNEIDEHVWTSPVNVMAISEAITACLIETRPESKELFEQRLAQYKKQLQQLDESFREIVKNGSRDTLFFGDRFPFLYFTQEYGLSYYAAFPGCSSESEPSAATMIYLVDKIREEQVPVVFTLALSSDKIADTLCEETGARKLVLQDCHNISGTDFEEGETYISLMKENAKNIQLALE